MPILRILVLVLWLTAPALAETGEGPRFYRLSDEDTTIYVLGTMHILDPHSDWLTDEIQDAFDVSQALILELRPAEMESDVTERLVGRYGKLPEGKTLADVLPARDYARLKAYFRPYGVDEEVYEEFQPWVIAGLLTGIIAQFEGLTRDKGVENVLILQAANRGMRIYGLEDAETQVRALSSLSDADQVKGLARVLEDLGDLDEKVMDLMVAWETGDNATLHRYMQEEIALFPDYNEAILYARNRDWAEKLNQVLNQNAGTYFLAVGAAHLIGEENLLALMRGRGFSISRIQ